MGRKSRNGINPRVEGKTPKSTHAERMEYARRLWLEDPSISIMGLNGMHARLKKQFGKAPTDEQLRDLRTEIATEMRQEAKRKSIIAEQANRQKVLKTADVVAYKAAEAAPAAERAQVFDIERARALKAEKENVADEIDWDAPFPQADQFDDPMRKRREYPQWFKDQVVRTVEARGERTVEQVCSMFGLGPNYYAQWRSPNDRQKRSTTLERARLRVLVFEKREMEGTPMAMLAQEFGIGSGTASRYASDRDAYVAAKERMKMADPDFVSPRDEWEAKQNPPESEPEPESPTSYEFESKAESMADNCVEMVRMLLEECPGISRLVVTNPRDGEPSIEIEEHVVKRSTISLKGNGDR